MQLKLHKLDLNQFAENALLINPRQSCKVLSAIF